MMLIRENPQARYCDLRIVLITVSLIPRPGLLVECVKSSARACVCVRLSADVRTPKMIQFQIQSLARTRNHSFHGERSTPYRQRRTALRVAAYSVTYGEVLPDVDAARCGAACRRRRSVDDGLTDDSSARKQRRRCTEDKRSICYGCLSPRTDLRTDFSSKIPYRIV